MIQTRFRNRAVLCFAFFLLVREAVHAELIVEIHNYDTCFDCSSAGTNFGFDIIILPGGPMSPRAEWSVFAAPADVGRTFSLSSQMVPVFDSILTHPEAIFGNLNIFGDAGHTFI